MPVHHRVPLAVLTAGALMLGGVLIGALASTAAAQPLGSAVGVVRAAAASAPVTTTVDGAKVVVDPAKDIDPSSNGSTPITVSASGLDPTLQLYVAICQRGGGIPKNLTSCLGGPIPDDNASTSWAVISSDQSKTPPGPVQGAIDDSGKFSVTLQLAGIADAAADCASGRCSVVIRQETRSNGVVIPVNFVARPGSNESSSSASSSSSSSSPSPTSTTPTSTTPTSTTPTSTTPTSTTPTSTTPTSTTPTSTTPTTTAPTATTVQAASILLPQVQAGSTQVAVFDGFTPGEDVTAALAGNSQVTFPTVKADGNGSVRIEWAVPADFPPAGYSLRVEGQASLRVGVADFEVIAAAVPSSASSSSSSASSSSPSSSPSSSSSSSSSASSTPSSTASSTTSSVLSTPAGTAVTTTAVATGVVNDSSSTPWWLWITLGILLIGGLVVAAILLGRQHRQQALREERRREQLLAAATSGQHYEQQSLIPMPPVAVPPTPPAGLGEYAEDPERPILFSHRQADNYQPTTDPIETAPTQQLGLGSLSTEAISPPPAPDAGRPASGPDAGPGPATGAWTPDFTGTRPPTDPGPGTAQFDPFADETAAGADTGSGGSHPAPDPGPGTQQFDPFSDRTVSDGSASDGSASDGSASDGSASDGSVSDDSSVGADGADDTPPQHSADDWDTPPER